LISIALSVSISVGNFVVTVILGIVPILPWDLTPTLSCFFIVGLVFFVSVLFDVSTLSNVKRLYISHLEKIAKN